MKRAFRRQLELLAIRQRLVSHSRRMNAEKSVVRLSGDQSNQIFTELAQWEQILKDTSLAKPTPPSL